jgi:hypothetical protein
MILALCGLLLGLPVGRGRPSRAETPVETVLPAEAEAAITGPGLATLFDHFSVAPASVFGRPAPAADWTDRLGFNPLVLEEWAERGIDAGRPVGLGMSDPRPRPDGRWEAGVLVCLPAADLEKARQAAEALVQRAFPGAVASTEGEFFRFAAASKGLQGAIAGRDGHLLAALGPGGAAMPLIRAAMGGETPLAAVSGFQALRKRMPDRDLRMFIDFEPFRRRMEAGGGAMAAPFLNDESARQFRRAAADYRWAGAGLDLAPSDLTVHGVVALRADSPTRRMMVAEPPGGRAPLLAAPSPPLLLSMGAMDPRAYLETLRAEMAAEERKAFDARLGAMGGTWGIDVKRELVGNLTGGFGVGFYDGLSLNMANYNTLFSAGVRDSDMARRTLASVVGRLAERGGVTVTETRVGETDAVAISVMGFLQLFAGVDGDRLLISVGRRMFQEAVAGGEPAPPADPAASRSLKDDPGVFFLDVGELLKAARNFSFLLTQFNRGRPVDFAALAPLEQLRYVMAAARPEGELVTGEFRVGTRFSQPFFKGLREVAGALAAARGTASPAPTRPNPSTRSE